MAIVAIIPGILAAIWIARHGTARAFLDVYLPVLLLLPDYFRFYAPGLPDPTMNQAAILPIAAAFLFRDRPAWRFSVGDVLVFGFAFMTAYTEFRAKGYSEAQNLMFDTLTGVVFPYLLAKGIIEPKGLREAFAKRFVLIMTVCAAMLPYETKMTRVLVRVPLDPFFRGQGNWTPTARWGLIRAAGPYGHAILAGVMFVVAYRIQRWLEWTGSWVGNVKHLPIRMTKARFLTLAMLGASVLTLVKGPWLGGLAAGLVLLALRARNRGAVGSAILAGVILVGIPLFIWFWSWAGVGRANALTTSQETAAYRKELIEGYAKIAAQKAIWGWGRTGWPTIAGMESTDNHYLLLSLNHGLVTLALFLGIQAWHVPKLIRLGVRRPRSDPSALLAFSLAGAYVVFLVSLATVYHGMQTVHLFFLVAGWADGLLSWPTASAAATAGAPVLAPAPAFAFRRVVT